MSNPPIKIQTKTDPKYSFGEHFQDLRRCLVRSCLGILVGSLIAYVFHNKLLYLFCKPFLAYKFELHYFSPQDGFMVAVQIAVVCGIVLASPIIIYEIWRFLSPAFQETEKRKVIPWILFSAGLFVTGVVFAYFTVLPMTIAFLMGYQTEFMKPTISIMEYTNFAGGLLLAFGFSFNMPILIVLLVMSGLMKIETLKKYRRHAIVIIFIIGTVLTPPDVASQMLLSIPLCVLYEISIWISQFVVKNKQAKKAAESVS